MSFSLWNLQWPFVETLKMAKHKNGNSSWSFANLNFSALEKMGFEAIFFGDLNRKWPFVSIL